MTEQEVDPAKFFESLKRSSKLSGADVLLKLGNSNQGMNIHMITNLKDVGSCATILGVADFLEKEVDEDLAAIDRNIVKYYEELATSKNGERAKDLISAIESVLKQEFEKDKLSNKMLGRSQNNSGY